ncbi:VOC family protein [Gemmatimonas groenlandica]|uniref:Glyoxalase n=1 Tax=Gemmatimonas groenlandica TaxID=2732249 RepID=A0A6M4ILM2_9BACT|nr:VOC family protein [Gemmatimonas groenlandica]QJR34397.1 glyoxalase [Gemmatimonas groenlandica]
MSTTSSILGLHHITLVASNAQRTVDFYSRVLGLRLVKTTVNFDDPGSYHLYFADETGSAGTVVTFFEWPRAPRGRTGIGGTHHFALRVADRDALLRWKRRLTDLGLRVRGPYDRQYFTSIYFRDPDGVILEIATDGPGMLFNEQAGTTMQRTPPAELVRGGRDEALIATLTWPEPVTTIDPAMALTRGMHHLTAMTANVERTDEFLRGVLGLSLVKQTENFDDPGTRHWSWGSPDARPGSLVTYLERPSTERRSHMGTGQGHHYALAVANETEQLMFRDRLLDAGINVSPVMDRVYFKSIYTKDPDGHIVELATMGPGFLVDEPVSTTGSTLRLPPWLEEHREQIEANIKDIDRSPWPYDGFDGDRGMLSHPGRSLPIPETMEAMS